MSLPTHVMVDLETIGVTPGSVVASIGAVVFDPHTGAWGPTFYAAIDQATSEALGLVKDPATVDWWSKQTAEAQAALTSNTIPATFAFEAFANWWRVNAGDRARFWCQGPSFDQAILEAAFRAAMVTIPWDYNSGRDTRTLYELAGVLPDKSTGELHNALDDAHRQASAVCAGYVKLGIKSPVVAEDAQATDQAKAA